VAFPKADGDHFIEFNVNYTLDGEAGVLPVKVKIRAVQRELRNLRFVVPAGGIGPVLGVLAS